MIECSDMVQEAIALKKKKREHSQKKKSNSIK